VAFADQYRHPSDLPPRLPLFPLRGAILLPGSTLPLNIFEPRYLAMVLDSLAEGRIFGMIQSHPAASEARGLFQVGCLGRISSFAETDDGRLLITLTGLLRFRVAEEVAPRRGYRRVRADYTPYLDDLDPAEPAALPRDALLAALRPYFVAKGIDANWPAIEQMSCPTLVTTLAMVCPFAVAEKQALLEAATPEARAHDLVTLLQMSARGGGELPPGGRPS
jgi:Lon protease-like protein